MTDTAQPLAAESDGFADAANAFKVAVGQEPAIEIARNANGQFAAAEPAEEIEEEIEPEAQPEAEPDSDVDDDDDEAADEAQPEAVAQPTSWSKEDEALWQSLPPEAQAKIAEREGQRDQAVNQKFQEAANVRRANEAIITEAITNRQNYAQAIDQVMSLIVPQEPPISMLDPNMGDYDPDGYHLAKAQCEQSRQYLGTLNHQRQQLAAQAQAEQQRDERDRLGQINAQTMPAFLADVPDAADPAKGQKVFVDLMDYAIKAGAPPEVFQTPLSGMEWHMIHKAQQWDKLQAAKGRVRATPPPPPRPVQPAVRPGVTTPRSAVQAARKQKDFSRLEKSGSIADGAAVFKHFLK